MTDRNEWPNIHQMFNYLNNRVKYVILRNQENILFQGSIIQDDVDLLTDNIRLFITLTDAIKLSKARDSVRYSIKINHHEVFFDIRSVGDCYYDDNWSKHLLFNRMLSDGGIYVLNNTDYFYSLLYHALIHKPKISTEYIQKLMKLASEAGILISKEILVDKKRAKAFLDSYMKAMGFKYSKPQDPRVYYNNTSHPYFRHVLSNIKTYLD